MRETRAKRIVAASCLLAVMVVPGTTAQGKGSRAADRAVAKALIERVEAPSLSVTNALSGVNAQLRRASTSADKAQKALDDLVAITAGAEASDQASTAALEARNAVTRAGALLGAITMANADADDELASATANLSDATFIAPRRIAAAVADIARTDDAVSTITATATDARAHIADAARALDGVSGSPETVAAARTGLTAADDAVAAIASSATEAHDHLASATTELGALPDINVRSDRLAPALAELAGAQSALAGIAPSSAAAHDGLTGVATTLDSLPVGSLNLSEPARVAYKSALDDAIGALQDVSGALTEVKAMAAGFAPKLEGAIEVVQGLQYGPNVGARSPTQLPPQVQALLDTLFGTLDSVTDIQATSGDTGSFDTALNQLLDLSGSAVHDVYQAAPPAAQGALNTVSTTILTVDGLVVSAQRTLFGVTNTVDGLVDTLGALIRTDGDRSCKAEVIDDVTIHYGSSDSDACEGTSGPDVFYVYGASDTVFAGGSADSLHLGNGGDNGHGENGADQQFGGAGSDSMWGGNGHDRVEDKEGQDVDTIYGGPGTDKGTVKDGDYQDYWWGGNGEDPYPAFDDHEILDARTGKWVHERDTVSRGNSP
ncbi:MAG TPA: hypothetical protein VIG64_13410 [Actinomycetota bacterium]